MRGFLPSAVTVFVIALCGARPITADDMPATAVDVPGSGLVDPTVTTAHPPLADGHRSAKLDSALVAVADEAIAAATFGAAAPPTGARIDIRRLGDRVHVEIATLPEKADDATRAIQALGGEVSGRGFGSTVLQAWVPVRALDAIAADDAVLYVRRPARIRPLESVVGALTVVSEALDAMNAPAWHAAGQRGAGVRVGIIDIGFVGYKSLAGSELPHVIAARSFVDGESSDAVERATNHGTACAEIIHDVAPDAELVLARIETAIDVEEAVDWMRGMGVSVISTSLGTVGDSPGDGTGPAAELVAAARASGIVWITAAGNYREQHWSGTFVDRNKDGLHDFAVDGMVNCLGEAGTCEIIGAGVDIDVIARWSDWDHVDQDFDVYVVRWNGLYWEVVAGGDNQQSGIPGQRPVEWVQARTIGAPTAYGVALQRYSGTRSVNLDLTVEWPGTLSQNVTARSLASPGDADAAITVGATEFVPPFAQKWYSSEGPTNGPGGAASGGLRKPDISGFAGVATAAFGPGFEGTSAATPHVAGAAALVRSAHPDWTVDQVEGLLLGRAIDLGPSGADDRFGAGRVYLGAPPTPPMPSATATASRTTTKRPSETATRTPPPTATRTALATATRTPSPPPSTATRTWTASRSPTGTTTATMAVTPNRTGTSTYVPTASATASPTASGTPAATPTAGPCYGDCDTNGRLSIDEVLLAVNLALGMAPLDRCPVADADHNGVVGIDEVLRAINATLFGCVAPPTASATRTERPVTATQDPSATFTPTVTATDQPTATLTAPPTPPPTATPTPTPTPTGTPELLPFLHAFVTNTDSDTVSVVSLDERRVIATIGGLGEPRSVAAAPDGTTAYVTERALGRVSIIDALSNRVVGQVAVGDAPGPVAVTADGRGILVGTDNGGGSLVFIDRQTAQVTADLPLGGQPLSVAVSPVAAKAYVGVGAAIKVVNLTPPGIADEILLPRTSEATDLEFIPSGALCLTASRPDNVLYIADGYADSGSSSIDLGSDDGGVAGIGDIPFTTLMVAAQTIGRRLTIVDRDSRNVIAQIPLTGEPVDVVARSSFYAFAPLRDPAGGAGLLAVINMVTQSIETTIGPLGHGVSDVALLEYHPPSEPATRTPTLTPTPLCPPPIERVSQTLHSPGNLMSAEYELVALRSTVRVSDPRQTPVLQIVVAADNCTGGGQVRVRAAIDGYGDRSVVIPVVRSGFCPSTQAATAVFALDGLPVGSHDIRVFVSGDRPFIGASLDVLPPPARLIEERSTSSSLSPSRDIELEVTDLALEFQAVDACEEYRAAFDVDAFGSPGMFSLRVAPDWADEVQIGPFVTQPTTAEAFLPRAPVGPHTIRVFLKHEGSSQYSYGLRLALTTREL